MLNGVFTNDKLFKASTIICAICTAIYIACFFSWSWNSGLADLPWLFIDVITGVCAIVLYVSYRRHNKNLMKGITGFLLASILMDDVQSMVYYLSINDAFSVFSIFYVVCAIIIVINHFIQSSSRKSNSVSVTVNQIVLLLDVLAVIVGYIFYMAASADFINPSVVDYISTIAEGFNFVFICTIIICVESRLDSYRIDRENAGWTEEEGYPEGYIHEYQKNK